MSETEKPFDLRADLRAILEKRFDLNAIRRSPTAGMTENGFNEIDNWKAGCS